ncbi:MAG: nitrate reductase cytochrome c-type subunit [Rhodospirillales bacterium]|nr:nitrate reductase cytochrome c-type subunit [Rhodospirillales bacterium]
MQNPVKKMLVALLCVGLGSIAVAGEPITTLRAGALESNSPAPAMAKPINSDIREIRNFPEQPPTIPHNIRGYQIDLNTNKCLSCHSRKAVGQSQAPMVSVTHFMDRDGQVLSAVTPRRYFCTQCHVPQHDIKPLVENEFIDADDLTNK